jgi:peptidylprolyl isomerase
MTEDSTEKAPSEAPLDNDTAEQGTDAAAESAGTSTSAIGKVLTTDNDETPDSTAEDTAVATAGASRPPRNTKVIVAVIVAILVVAGVAIGLVTRGGSSSEAKDPNTSTTFPTKSTSLDDVKVTGEFGEKPSVSFKAAFVGKEESFKVVLKGDGPVVTEGQRVTLDYVAYSGADGSELDSTFGQAPQAVTASRTTLTAALADALIGQTIGSRVMVAGDQTQSQPAAWVIFVFDIKSAETLPTEASGTPQTPQPGFPTVTVENGVPKIAKPSGDPSSTLGVEVLIKGNGPAVASGQTVTMQYTGIIWASGEEFDSSWGGDPIDFPIGTGQVIPGFDEGLIGQTVGSRVVLVIPPDKGYGTAGNAQAGISGTDTLVFVVDILAAS